jgi:release factor glutamine methyltransferase
MLSHRGVAWYKTAMTQPPKVWTIAELLQATTDFFFKKSVDEVRLSAELLLAHALGCSRMSLYTQYDRVPSDSQRAAFREMVRERAEHVPVAYLIGKAWFYSLEFHVTRDVLIPRPDTETLVEQVISGVRGKPGWETPGILDLCTGSGCIAVTLAKNLPTATVTATDISAKALEVARKNAAEHKVEERVALLLGDLWEAVDKMSPPAMFHVIASNPPYVPASGIAGLMPSVRDHEPRIALVAGEDGHAFHRKIVAGAKGHLHEEGLLIQEMQFDQQEGLVKIYEEAGWLEGIRVLRDAAGHPRCVVGARKKG